MLEQETMIPPFTKGNAGITELLEYLHEIEDLKALSSLAEWDQNTEMPEGAGEVRGYQSATLQGVLHERWTNQRLGTLLNKLNAVINRSGYTDADRGLVREGIGPKWVLIRPSTAERSKSPTAMMAMRSGLYQSA